MMGLWQCEGVRDCATVVWEVLSCLCMTELDLALSSEHSGLEV